VNGDGKLDIASGLFIYLNPGGEMAGRWTQVILPGGAHVFATLDVDDDAFVDLIAQKDNGANETTDLYWLEATDKNGADWAAPILIGSVPGATEPEGSQGYTVAQINADGPPQIVVNSPKGLFYFTVPASNPEAGSWQRTFIAPSDSEEGIGLADIDADGDLDISFTTALKQVEWASNPGDGAGDWDVFVIGAFTEAAWLDRCAAGDLNGDGRVDIMVTEENIGSAPDARSFWWEQPAAAANSPNWIRHTIASQYTTNSMDLGDVDDDGDADIVLAEHRGTKRIAVFANDGHGDLTAYFVDEGKESHLGARLVDLDSDGDLDLVSIAYDQFNEIHLWRNESSHSQ